MVIESVQHSLQIFELNFATTKTYPKIMTIARKLAGGVYFQPRVVHFGNFEWLIFSSLSPIVNLTLS